MLKFKCFMEGVAEQMPIIPTKEHNFMWLQKARDFFAQNQHLVLQTTKCPGIISMLNTGWIHRSYQDIIIETNGDGYNFSWRTPIDQITTKNGKFIGDYVNFHLSYQLSDFYTFPQGTLRTVVNIQSPWFVEIPKGYSLLMMPMSYNEENRFTAATGLLKGNQYLNVQLYWHCLNSVELVKAGTPLNQMLLIKDDVVAYDIETLDDAENYLKEKFKKYDIYT